MSILSASPSAKQSVSELRALCQRRGLATTFCVERADLEELLRSDGGVTESPALAQAAAELDSWVTYAPRAEQLLGKLDVANLDVHTLKRLKLGIIAKRYTKHPDSAVVNRATKLVTSWKERFLGTSPSKEKSGSAATQTNLSSTSQKANSGKRHKPTNSRKVSAPVDDDDSDNSSSSSSSSNVRGAGRTVKLESIEDDDVEVEGENLPSSSTPCGWTETVSSLTYRGRKEHFVRFTLHRPFRCDKWTIEVRVAKDEHENTCRELLHQMAKDFGAVVSVEEKPSAEDEQVVQRLQRLEDRFKGSGVTEGEARNAMRLFERELSKANWTQEKFAQLKRQMEGTEEWTAADVVAECSLRWTSDKVRRQAWFTDACHRVAVPLGLEFGYCRNGGCCFVGPLSAAAGATMTAALVCHLGDLDLERALRGRGGSQLSRPQFLQGFVDGSLEKERHLVWEKLFSIEDEREARRFCQENLNTGFFDGAGTAGQDDEDVGDGADVQSMLRGLFAPTAVPGGGNRGQRTGSSASLGGSAPSSFAPFSGKSFKLVESDDAPLVPPKPEQSWAITFATNLELARKSRRRSSVAAQKTFHWTSGGCSVKATRTDTQSYSNGRQAGEKRKGEIDGFSGSSKRKFQGRGRLAITR